MTLADLNLMEDEIVYEALFKCCGSKNWCNRMMNRRPFMSERLLLSYAEKTLLDCNEEDWKEAFDQHPKIGDLEQLEEKYAATKEWAEGEQQNVKNADPQVLKALLEGNEEYEQKFGYIFIVFATGKSAAEMLKILQERLKNDPEKELPIAVHEQSKITKLRLEKLIA